MEKSISKTSQKHGSGDENYHQRDDEQPTTSKGDNFSPEQISHNMNDFQALDFNSADEVRQAMKAVLAGKIPPQGFTEEPAHVRSQLSNLSRSDFSESAKMMEQAIQVQATEEQKPVQRPVQQKRRNNTVRVWTSKPNRIMPSRLMGVRGRSPKPGPSKGIKKRNVSSMYIGKLSNVAPFKHRWESDSESDVESVIIFY